MTCIRRFSGRGFRALVVLPTLAVLLASIPAPAFAWNTLVEGEKGKLDVEFRLMAWAMHSGPDLPFLPGVNSAPPPAQSESIDDFFIRRMRLAVRGNVSDSLEMVLQLGMDNAGSKTLRDDAGFRIKDAYINYKKTDGLQIAVGQFKVPFLRMNLESGFNQLLVDRSLVANLRPAVEGSRDLGGMVWGSHGGLQYRAAMLDGSDQEDTNTQSSIRGSARVAYNWFTPEPGLSYTGTTFGQKKILQIGGQADKQNGRIDARDEAGFTTEQRAYTAWAADLFWDQPIGERWALTAEAAYVQRRDDYDIDGLATRSQEGRYAQAGLLLPWDVGPGRLQIVGRWDEIENERAGVVTEGRSRLVGFTWFTKGHDRKIQFDHGDLVERPTDLDDNFYRLSFVLVF